MKTAMERLYGSKVFDPEDRGDQIGETARLALIDAAASTRINQGVMSGEDMPYLLGGLIVGIVQILQATASCADGMSRDEIDAAIRASIMQIAPWAVDMARSVDGLEPLADA